MTLDIYTFTKKLFLHQVGENDGILQFNLKLFIDVTYNFSFQWCVCHIDRYINKHIKKYWKKNYLIIHSNDECRNLALLMQISFMLQWWQVEFTLNFSQTTLAKKKERKKREKKIKSKFDIKQTFQKTFNHSVRKIMKSHLYC